MTSLDPRRPRGGARGVRLARYAAAATALSLSLAACGAGGDRESDPEADGGGSSEVGVTDDSIKLGGHFPLTGVAAPGYSEIPTGAKAYFDYVNANGGIYGRQIEYLVEDDAYNPSNTSKVTDQLVLQDEIFAMVGGLGTPTHSAVIDFLNQEGVPDMFVSSGALAWGDDVEENPYTFGWQPDYEIEGKIIGQYVADNMPKAKVGLFLQDDDFGRDGEKGVRQYIDDQVVERRRKTHSEFFYLSQPLFHLLPSLPSLPSVSDCCIFSIQCPAGMRDCESLAVLPVYHLVSVRTNLLIFCLILLDGKVLVG